MTIALIILYVLAFFAGVGYELKTENLENKL